jgi:hypothetical protein
MILILFIVLLIIILLYIYIQSKNHFQGKIIKGTEIKNSNFKDNLNNTNIYLGKSVEQDFLTYDTQFKFKISSKENYYLFNGINCPQQESSDACFKRNSNFVYEALLSKEGDEQTAAGAGAGQTNKDETNMFWAFFDVERQGNNYINYGDEVLLKNLGKTVSYLCICDTNPIDVDTCGTVYNIYCYDDLKDAEEYGKWIIIPKHFRTDYYKSNMSKENVNPFRKYTGGLKDKNEDIINSTDPNGEATAYDFYNDYDLANLKSKEIPISVKDEFLIINSKTVDGKYIYLNLCNNLDNNPWLQLDCYNNKYTKVIGTSASLNKFGEFTTKELEMEIFNWSIEPIIYDVNVHDTLFVYGSIDVGPEDNITNLTLDKLKYIKSIPYYFKNKICLKGEDDTPNCIEKHHMEMLNGSRPINIKSITQSKPFKLYTGISYTGREFRIGFNYENAKELPYLGDFNSWLNPGDHGKWKSLKIEGPYNAIIYSKPNFGYGDSDVNIKDNYNLTQDEANAIVERAQVISDIKDVKYDKAIAEGEMPDFEITNTILEKEKVNPLYFVVSSPGISDVTKLGDDWIDGIRSIKFYKPREELYELKCLEKYPFTYQPNTDETPITEELMTANLCKNGSTNQQFYFSGENDNNYEPDIYKTITDNHVHFHRHPYDSEHEGVSLIPEPITTLASGSPNMCVPEDKKAEEYCLSDKFHHTLKCKKKDGYKNYRCD